MYEKGSPSPPPFHSHANPQQKAKGAIGKQAWRASSQKCVEAVYRIARNSRDLFQQCGGVG
jgi:hypothetical protein